MLPAVVYVRVCKQEVESVLGSCVSDFTREARLRMSITSCTRVVYPDVCMCVYVCSPIE